MTPLRILQINSRLTGGGADDRCVWLAAGLLRLGQQVWIAGPDGRQFSELIQRLKLPKHTTPSRDFIKIRFIISVARFVRRERIQLLNGHHGSDFWPTILAGHLSGIRPRIVLTRRLAKSPASWASRLFLLGQCDAVIAVSHFVARVLREGHYEPDSPVPERRSRSPLHGDYRKLHVIHAGIDTDSFRPGDGTPQRQEWGLDPSHFAFALVGAYDLPHGKGQRIFLQAAAAVHKEIPEARFLIIGRGNLADVLRDDITRLGLSGKALLTPYCRDMPAAMNAIDCLVLPQIGTEALPGVICEAQACGRPVIASDLDGIPEALAIGEVGQLVMPGNVAELARAMKEWSRRPRMTDRERADIHRRVTERFSIDVSARNHLRLYRSLIYGNTGKDQSVMLRPMP
jgi:glycosyltransferase involved in cell wall biosynthesis